LEIIIVNDGSTDATGDICRTFAEKDSRITVIHRENEGVSSARNLGLEKAKGEYISFIDSDDYVSSEMYETMLSALIESNAEMCVCNVVQEDEHDNVINITNLLPAVHTRSLIFQQLSKESFYGVLWNKLYKTDAIKDLRFPVGRIHEDEFFAHYAFDRCERVVVIEPSFYHYVQREKSITKGSYSIKRLDGAWAFYDRFLFFKTRGFETCANCAIRRSGGVILTALRQLPYCGHEKEFDEVVKIIVPELRLLHQKIRILCLYRYKKRFHK